MTRAHAKEPFPRLPWLADPPAQWWRGLRGCQLRPRHPSWRCARARAVCSSVLAVDFSHAEIKVWFLRAEGGGIRRDAVGKVCSKAAFLGLAAQKKKMLSALSALGLQPALQPDSLLESSNRSSAARADPPVVAPLGQWTRQPGDLNCYDGHGAPGASGEAHAKSISIEDCKAACLEASGCLAIVVEFDSPPETRAWSNDVTCYLREQIWMEECVQGAKNYELHTFARAPPPPPPSPPPFSISRLSAAGQINYRFRMGRPSDNLTEV